MGNHRVENELTGGKRESLALDKRVGVLALATMFSSKMQVEEDPANSLRKRSTTVSTSQTDINSNLKSIEKTSSIERDARPKSAYPVLSLDVKEAKYSYGSPLKISTPSNEQSSTIMEEDGKKELKETKKERQKRLKEEEKQNKQREENLRKQEEAEIKRKNKEEKQMKKQTAKSKTANQVLDERTKKREKLIKQGYLKPEEVFGNSLHDVPKYTNSEDKRERQLPMFLVKIIHMIERKKETVGLYRVNGDASEVQQIRYAVNQNNYAVLEDCKNIATLTSTVKLFLREMPKALINREMVNYVKSSKIDLTGKGDHKNLISQLKKSLGNVDKTSYRVLNFLLAHAKRVADEEANKMDTNNMAIVMGPNIVVNNPDKSTDYSIVLTEMEMTQRLVEMLIIHVKEVFEEQF